MPRVRLAATHPPLPAGNRARCGATLHRNIPNGPDRALALTLTGLILFVIANLFPLLSIRIQGQTLEMTLFAGVETLYRQGAWLLALVVFFTGILAPGMRLALLLGALIPIRR